jgi:hypothetical protein
MDNEHGGKYAVGISISNTEIGDAPARIHPFLFRSACWNGTIFGKQAAGEDSRLVIRHTGKEMDYPTLCKKIQHAVKHAFEQSGQMAAIVEAADRIELTKPGAFALREAVDQLGLRQSDAQAWWNGVADTLQERGEELTLDTGFSYGDLLSGLTRAAQGYTGSARVALEGMAGEMYAASLDDTADDLKRRATRLNNAGFSRYTANELEVYLTGSVQAPVEA